MTVKNLSMVRARYLRAHLVLCPPCLLCHFPVLQMQLLPTLRLPERILLPPPGLVPSPSLPSSGSLQLIPQVLVSLTFHTIEIFFECLLCIRQGGRHRSFKEDFSELLELGNVSHVLYSLHMVPP